MKEIHMKKILLLGCMVPLLFFGCKSNQPVECVDGDCVDGKGTIQLKSGSKYVGQFNEGARAGEGTYSWTNKETYAGQWSKNQRDGNGMYVYPNGAKYTGEFKGDRRHGQGTYIWPNGDKYIGQWKEGVMDGKGVYTYSNGAELKGIFENNAFIRREEIAPGNTEGADKAGAAGAGAAEQSK
jgi:hypothetical protein